MIATVQLIAEIYGETWELGFFSFPSGMLELLLSTHKSQSGTLQASFKQLPLKIKLCAHTIK